MTDMTAEPLRPATPREQQLHDKARAAQKKLAQIMDRYNIPHAALREDGRQRDTDLHADLERARDVAVALENENARMEAEPRDLRGALDWQTSCLACARVLESGYRETARADRAEQRLDGVLAEHTKFVLKAGDRIGQADALAELHRRDLEAETARAERAEQQLDQVRALHTVEFSDEYGGRECSTCREVWPCPTVAALDGAQQPDPDDPPNRCPNPAAHVQVRPRPRPAGEGSDR